MVHFLFNNIGSEVRECVLQTKSSRAVLVCKIQEAALQLKQFIFLLRTQESQFHFPPIFKNHSLAS